MRAYTCSERSAKGRERKKGERGRKERTRAKGCESEKNKRRYEREREKARKGESIVVHGDTHIYSLTHTCKHMEMHTDTYTRHI